MATLRSRKCRLGPPLDYLQTGAWTAAIFIIGPEIDRSQEQHI